MLNQPSWFNQGQYFNQKANELAGNGSTMTRDEMVDAINGMGGAWVHYETYGYKEHWTLSDGTIRYMDMIDSIGFVQFSAEVYCTSKLKQLVAAGDSRVNATSTWQDVAKIITEDANMSLYDHFVMYGQIEGLSISDTFSAESFFKAKLKQLQSTGTMPSELNGSATWQQLAAWYAERGIDSYENFITYGRPSEGITDADVKPGAGGEDPGPGPDPVEGKTIDLYPQGWHTNEDGNLVYRHNNDLKGTDSNDLFLARIYGDLNSLNTGDKIDGKGGVDTLEASITDFSFDTALTPEIKDVEILKFRVQEQTKQTGDNNVRARIDAEKIEASTEIRTTPMEKSGAYTEFWSSNSRDDLLIEDVRIDSRDVIVGMQNTDPGDVDYKFYFDPLHLVDNGTAVSGQLVLRLLDTQSAAETSGAQNLTNNPFDRVTFSYGGASYTVVFGDHGVVSGTSATYQTLLDAVNAALAEIPELAGVKAAFGEQYSRTDTKSGKTVWGTEIVLKGVDEFEKGRWGTPDGTLPDTGAIDYEMAYPSSEECPLLVTNVALDNVGRVLWDDASPDCLPDNAIYGSNAGDLVIGSMATRGGIERFDVYVDRGSWLSSLSSTNNTLRMIKVAAADWNGDDYANSEKAEGQGQLFIGDHATMKVDGQRQAGVVGTDQTLVKNTLNWQDKARLLWAGDYYNTKGEYIDTAGILDVKLFDATAYAGVVNIAAKITEEAYAKYLGAVDGLRTVYDKFAPSGEFKYGFGSNNDTLNMDVDGGILADRDFELVIEMNDGNDYVNYRADFSTGNQAISQAGKWSDLWSHYWTYGTYNGLQNVTIDTGNGDDTVWTWGKYSIIEKSVSDEVKDAYDGVFGYVKVDAGAGDDAVYMAQQATIFAQDQNTKEWFADAAYNAVWVVNANTTGSEDAQGVYYDAVGQAQPISNNIASTKDYIVTAVNGTHTVKVEITFLGVTAEATVDTYTVTSGSYNVSADALNKAIIKAVNGSPLSKLLAAFDGAGNSLLLQSLIDGRYTMADIDIKVYDENTLLGLNLLQQAHDMRQGETTSKYESPVYYLDVSKGGGDDFDADAVGVIYTITVNGVNVTYTQQLSDKDWTDIVTGLRADLATKTELKGYDIQYVGPGPETATGIKGNAINAATGEALHRNQLAIVDTTEILTNNRGSVNTEISYSIDKFTSTDATLTLSFRTNWGSTPVVGNDYVITFEHGGSLYSLSSGKVTDAANANWTWVKEQWEKGLSGLETFLGLDADTITISGTTTLKFVLEGVDVTTSRDIEVDYIVRSSDGGTRTIHTSTVDFLEPGGGGAFAEGDVVSLSIEGISLGSHKVTAGGALDDWDAIYGEMKKVFDANTKLTEQYTLAKGAADGQLIITDKVAQTDEPAVAGSLVKAVAVGAYVDIDTLNAGVAVVEDVVVDTDALPAGDASGEFTAVTAYTLSFQINGGPESGTTDNYAIGTSVPTWDELVTALNGKFPNYTIASDGVGSFSIRSNDSDKTTVISNVELSYKEGAGADMPVTVDDGYTSYLEDDYSATIAAADLNWEDYIYGSDIHEGNTSYTITVRSDAKTFDLATLRLAADTDKDGTLTLLEFATYLNAQDLFNDNDLTVSATVAGDLVFKTDNRINMANVDDLPVIRVTATDPVTKMGGDDGTKMETFMMDLYAWANDFVPGHAGAGTIYAVEISDGTFNGLVSYTQHAGDETWADVVEQLDKDIRNWDAGGPKAGYAITALEDGVLRISMSRDTVANPPLPTINGLVDVKNIGIVTITDDNYTQIGATANQEILVNAWDFTDYNTVAGGKYPSGYKMKTYTLIIDLDGNPATTNDSVTLSYTERAHSDETPDSWADIVTNLNSMIKNDKILDGVCEIQGGGVNGSLKVVFKDVDTDDISTYVRPTVTVVYDHADEISNYSLSSAAENDLRGILKTVWTDQRSETLHTKLVGDDLHYYGYSEVYGGDGDDVLVTGYANAIVYGGAGNDVIVVGNETYNVVYGGVGEDTIWLGARSDVEDGNGTVWYQGNNGNNMGTTQSNPDAHDKIFVGVGEGGDVIHNFDVGGIFNYQISDAGVKKGINSVAIQSDRLYLAGLTADSLAEIRLSGADGVVSSDSSSETVTLVGVGNVSANLVADVKLDTTANLYYIEINAA